MERNLTHFRIQNDRVLQNNGKVSQGNTVHSRCGGPEIPDEDWKRLPDSRKITALTVSGRQIDFIVHADAELDVVKLWKGVKEDFSFEKWIRGIKNKPDTDEQALIRLKSDMKFINDPPLGILYAEKT